MSGRVLFVSDDILFWGRVQAAARPIGRDVRRIGDEAAMESALAEGGVSRVVFDLSSRSVDPLSWAARWKRVVPPPDLVAFGPHVDAAGLAAAEAAGFDRVLPNSRFHRELSALLAASD